ncbi:universal stress protein [Kitasatospora sp. NPDC056181]|uniref:universal stress protein n=1 Tax=Kitasatospora sp. NPDC056181 TaxID=3345737 RepID=UPI0035D90672
MTEGARVIVGISGSLANLAALHRAVEEAVFRGAVLVPVIAWTPVGGEPAYRTQPCPPLARLWAQAARERLDEAFEQAFGGYPEGVRIEPMVLRAEAGRALVAVADRPDDLLVVGAGRRGRLPRILRPSVSRYCQAHAACTVVTVPPSELLKELRSADWSADPLSLVAA